MHKMFHHSCHCCWGSCQAVWARTPKPLQHWLESYYVAGDGRCWSTCKLAGMFHIWELMCSSLIKITRGQRPPVDDWLLFKECKSLALWEKCKWLLSEVRLSPECSLIAWNYSVQLRLHVMEWCSRLYFMTRISSLVIIAVYCGVLRSALKCSCYIDVIKLYYI